MFQGRHGIDVIIDNQGIDRAKVAGRLLGHFGYLVRTDFEVSIEASQVYFFASDDKVTGPVTPETAFAESYRTRDGRRSAFTFGPAIRATFADVDLGAALVTNLDDPLSPAAASFVGFRLSLIAHVPPPGN